MEVEEAVVVEMDTAAGLVEVVDVERPGRVTGTARNATSATSPAVILVTSARLENRSPSCASCFLIPDEISESG